MVNGGGTLRLEFSKNQLKTNYISINVMWNQFVYIDSVIMYLNEDLKEQTLLNSTCDSMLKNYINIYPKIHSSWNEIRDSYYDKSMMIIPDSGIVRNELPINDSKFKLIYQSNLLSGYLSTIYLLLTNDKIPTNLQLVHLKIVVEGVLFKQTFDACEDLKYEYFWDRRNAYEQKVYGFTFAKIMVGYQYEDCSSILWKSFVVKLAGYDLGSSEIGNFNLDIHHRLNTQQGNRNSKNRI
jgi:hypothetical protein